MLLFETLSQPLIFVITLAIGFASGLLVDARNYIHFLCNKNKIVGLVLDIIVSFLCFFIMLICVLSFNFGQLRFYFVIAFVCGLLFERFSLGLIIAKIALWCYNQFVRILRKITNGKFKKANKEKTLD